MRYCLAFMLVALTVAAGGCNWIAFFGTLLPAPKKTVEAEFIGLEKKQVAIAVYVGLQTELDFQTIRLEISDAVAAELGKRIEGAVVVDSRRVIRYQDENPRWKTVPPETLCTVFDCDYLLLISLIEFSTRERGSLHMIRGRLKAESQLYRPPASGKSSPAWASKEPFSVAYPPENPVGVLAKNDWEVRTKTEKLFAEVLVRKFYKHKVLR